MYLTLILSHSRDSAAGFFYLIVYLMILVSDFRLMKTKIVEALLV